MHLWSFCGYFSLFLCFFQCFNMLYVVWTWFSLENENGVLSFYPKWVYKGWFISLIFHICCSVSSWKHILAFLMLSKVVSSLRMKMFILTLCTQKCFVKVGCLNSSCIYVVVFSLNGSVWFSKWIHFTVSIVMSSTRFLICFMQRKLSLLMHGICCVLKSFYEVAVLWFSLFSLHYL